MTKKNWEDLDINIFLTSVDTLMTSNMYSSEIMLNKFREDVYSKLKALKFEDLFDKSLKFGLKCICKEFNLVCDLLEQIVECECKIRIKRAIKSICENYLMKYAIKAEKNRIDQFYRVVGYFPSCTIEDLCHKKENISEGRYNKQNVACSYLSEHALLSWLEAKRPVHFYCGTFNVKDGIFLRVESPKQFIDKNGLNCLSDKGPQTCQDIMHYLICLPVFALMSISHDIDKNAYKFPQLVMEYLTYNVEDFCGIYYFNNQEYIKFLGEKEYKFNKYNFAVLSKCDFDKDGCSHHIKQVLRIEEAKKVEIDCRDLLEGSVASEFKKQEIYL